MIRTAIRFLLLTLVLSLSSRVSRGAVKLNALGAYLISCGYGGAQLIDSGKYYHLPIIANGTPGNLVIDTGAPTTLIFRSSLKRFGLTESKTNSKEGGAFGHGHDVYGITNIGTLKTGNCTLTNVPVAIATNSGSPNSYGQPNGLLGLRELVKFGAIVDFSSRIIYLRPSRPGTEVATAVRSILERSNFKSISLSLERQHLRVPGRINEIACHFIVDSGAFLTLLDREFASHAKLGGVPTHIEAHGIGKSGGEVSIASFSSLWVGNYEIKQASASVTALDSGLLGRGTSSEVEGLLGIEYLALNSAIFDFVSGTLYLRPTPR